MESNKFTLYKTLGWLLTTRIHYILFIGFAQYLVAGYIFSHEEIEDTLLDINLSLLVGATICSVAAGYILDDHLDLNRDIINYPIRAQVTNINTSRAKRFMYILLNSCAVIVSFFVSWRVAVFFVLYIVGVWFYNILLKHLVIIGNMVCVSLMMIPFFVLELYYRYFEVAIIPYAVFLAFLLFLHLCIKDIRNISGDYVHHHYTVANVYGIGTARVIIHTTMVLSIILAALISVYADTGLMLYYFYLCVFLLFICLFSSLVSKRQHAYRVHHYVIKSIIVLGVLSVMLYKL